MDEKASRDFGNGGKSERPNLFRQNGLNQGSHHSEVPLVQVSDPYRLCQQQGVPIDLEPTNKTWGNREMYLKDPDGNSIRFVREGGG